MSPNGRDQGGSLLVVRLRHQDRDSRPEVWHALTPEEALARLESTSTGISEAEAKERLERFGANTLSVVEPASAWKILVDQLRSVVVLLLFAATAVAFLLGDPLDSAAILSVLLINTVLGFVVELRARRAMEALLDLEVPHAEVIRKGEAREIEARELVPGDVIRVEAGQSVPGDVRLLEAQALQCDEAALTGESMPVSKVADPVLDTDTPLPDRQNMMYKSTTVVTGTGTGVLTATGMETELGRIGVLVGGIEEERTPLERRLDVLGRRLVWVALAVGGVVTAVGLLRGMPLGQMVETGIALAIAAVPEGLPAVATIALAVGVRRMARRNALVRRLPAVETLGSVTVICTDKTGTLTAGEMMVTTLWVAGHEIHVTGNGYEPVGDFEREGSKVDVEDEHLEMVLRIGALANRSDVEQGETGWEIHGDPTEAALLVAASKAGLTREELLEEWPNVGEVPFSSERQLMATFHRSAPGQLIACLKGAPGRVVELCGKVVASEGETPLDDGGRERLLEVNRELASRGLRVLALASGEVDRPEESALEGLLFVGLAGIIDPAAADVEKTIRGFREAGIRTVMITGDQKLTAEAIGRDLGILSADDEILSGRELEGLSDEQLTQRVETVTAFSRISPEAKLRIVSAYQRHGDIAAMLGDGVNDAAALKKADVGVAMGERGTDVAKEAAAVVLQDDRFATVGAAIEDGRVIYDNIRKFVFYLFSCNLAEVFVLLGAAIVGLPLPLLPLQILWLNVVTDTFPALALALEPAEPDVMRRPPRSPQEAILSRAFLRAMTWFALLITAVTLVAFLWGLASGPADRAVTLTFMTLALAQTFHLGNARSPGPVVGLRRAGANPYAIGAVALVISLQLLAVYLPPLARVLGVVPLSVSDWFIVAGLAAVPALAGQVGKLRRSHAAKH
ncbi:MAG: HAD-IC family P-type ATPase [Gemmatimonas sp.]|nr:HAD-IC family P-type ATPase [Gemmatimonas sp.]